MTRVLLIDDESGFTSLLTLNLESKERFEVAVVNDPRCAVVKALEFRPNIILLDVVMPGLDGGDVLILLQSEEELKNIPVILMSAIVNVSDTPAGSGVAEEAGQIMLAKPVSIDTIIRVIDSTLESHLTDL